MKTTVEISRIQNASMAIAYARKELEESSHPQGNYEENPSGKMFWENNI